MYVCAVGGGDSKCLKKHFSQNVLMVETYNVYSK